MAACGLHIDTHAHLANMQVMGFSHADAATVANFHKNDPTKPLVMSECCSCETQRGEDSDQPVSRCRQRRSTFSLRRRPPYRARMHPSIMPHAA